MKKSKTSDSGKKISAPEQITTVEIYNKYKLIEKDVNYTTFHDKLYNLVMNLGLRKCVDNDGYVRAQGNKIYYARMLAFIRDDGNAAHNGRIGFLQKNAFIKQFLSDLFDNDRDKVSQFLELIS